MPKQPKEYLACPVCKRDIEKRGFKNHLMSKHDYSKVQANDSWIQVSGRRPKSWGSLQEEKDRINASPRPQFNELPPEPPGEDDISNSEWWQGFREGVEFGLRKKRG